MFGSKLYDKNYAVVDPSRSRKVATAMNASQHPCPNLRCSKVFTTPQYLQRHRLKCKTSEIGRRVSMHCNVPSLVFLYHAPNELTPCSISLTACHPKYRRFIKENSLFARPLPCEKSLTFGFTAELAISISALWDLSSYVIM